LFTRSIRPNRGDTPAVEQTTATPPGVEIEPGDTGPPLPIIRPSAWAGWPDGWATPNWQGQQQALSDTAWMCLDLNSSVLSTMPPYLVAASPNLNADWLTNPDPDTYSSWEEFAKRLFWDYQLGEAFVLATAFYSTGFPARFHVVPPWTIQVEFDSAGKRRYTIGSTDVTPDVLHLRYTSSVDQAHGTGPLEVGAGRVIAARVLQQYATNLAASGGIPSSILEHPDELSAEQSAALQAQWVAARMSSIGEPAVLSGGVQWRPTQLNPTEMALVDLSAWNEARIATLLGVPPFLVGLPTGGDSMTYSNVSSIFDYHWRAGLRPKAHTVMSGLSQWLTPRGTRIEVNRDAYVQAEPLARAQTWSTLAAIVDKQGNPVVTVEEIRAAERIDDLTKGLQ
jgi:HK97 family phage portal protein